MEPRSDAIERQEKLKEFMMDYWLRLQQERRQNISQNEFAAILGWSNNVMSRVIRGTGLPSLENTIQAAQVVGTEIYDIVGYPRLAYDDQDFQQIMDLWPKMTEEVRRKLVSNLREMIEQDSEKERAHAPNAQPITA